MPIPPGLRPLPPNSAPPRQESAARAHPELAGPDGGAAGLQMRRGLRTAPEWTGTKNGNPPQKEPFLIPDFCPELKITDSSLILCQPHFKSPLCKNTVFSFCILLLKYIVLPIPPHNKNFTLIFFSPDPAPNPAQVPHDSLPIGHFGVCPLEAMWKPPRASVENMEGVRKPQEGLI